MSILSFLRIQYNAAVYKASFKSKLYHVQATYSLIDGTPRKCENHPSVSASYWRRNTQDPSYKRAICLDCMHKENPNVGMETNTKQPISKASTEV